MAAINSTQSPKFDGFEGAHKPFSFIAEDARKHPLSGFVAPAMDLCQEAKQ